MGGKGRFRFHHRGGDSSWWVTCRGGSDEEQSISWLYTIVCTVELFDFLGEVGVNSAYVPRREPL